MSASLVGSEMCIRDSCTSVLSRHVAPSSADSRVRCRFAALVVVAVASVSYTHLTLPTICSV
eukprot:14049778-Alexandrium_andersonii.AAC.1